MFTQEELKKIQDDAHLELKEEARRKLIDELKIKIKQRKTFWNRLFPYRVKFYRINKE